jgi:hypothetical protein
MPPLKDFDYSAFISYAHADDEAWYGWVSCFRAELERGLRALLRGQSVPRMHLSGDNGPIAGLLGDELQQRVAASFAMIIVVHENYAQSAWCLKELAYFKALFGEQGLRERLYIVALSEPSIQRVSRSAAWQELLPGGEQLWLPFYDPADPARPLDIYMSPGIVANAFRTPFERLRGDLAAKLRQAQVADAKTPPFDPLATAPVVPAPPVTPAVPGAEVLFGFVAPAAVPATSAAVARLSSQGVPARLLGHEAMISDFADFDAARHLVLVCDDAPLLMGSMAAGGHLQLQRDAWLRKARPADGLHWLDLRAAPTTAATAAPPAGAAFAASLGANLLDIASLAALLQPKPAAATKVSSTVRIYIESNRNERNLWEALGEQIRLRWDAISREVSPERVPPLALRPRGLPVDQIDTFPNLDDADGVVLLWGKKTSDALVAQINKVENKMAPGRDAAPGIVAYLMPPQLATEPMPAWGWQVLRFDARDEEAIDVVAEERDELSRFLRKVLRRCQLREAAAGATG